MTANDPPSPFLLLRRGERMGGADGDPNDPLDVFAARGVLTPHQAQEGVTFRVLHRARYGSRAVSSGSLEFVIPAGFTVYGEPVEPGEVVREQLAWREAVLRKAGRAIESAVRGACLDMNLAVMPELVRDGLERLRKAGPDYPLTRDPNREKEAETTGATSASGGFRSPGAPPELSRANGGRVPSYPRPNNAPPPARLDGEPGTVAFIDGRFVDLPAIEAGE